MQHRHGAVAAVLRPAAIASLPFRLSEVNMSPETENFESLRRLLALKRHELPPPGYFNTFSRQVIVRIQAGERGEDKVGFGQWLLEGAWLQRFWNAFETKPALAGAFGVMVCGLLISGVIYSDQPVNNRDQGLAALKDPGETPSQAS